MCLTTSGNRVQSAPHARRPALAALSAPFRLWWESNRVALTHALLLVVGARAVLGVVAALAQALLPEQVGLHDVYHRSDSVWLDVWARWDSEYYLDIAQHGYSARPELIAFFPLYPALIALVAPVVGQDYVLAGVVVSSLSCFVALAYLFKLAAWELGQDAAARAVMYVAVHPMALFLLAVYSESLFLAVTAAACHHARRGQWGAAALAACLAGAARPNGMLLLLPLAYEAWRQRGARLGETEAARVGRVMAGGLAAAAAPLATLAWGTYVVGLARDPLAFAHRLNSPPWERTPSLPWVTVGTAVQNLADGALSPFERAVNGADVAAAILLIGASVLAWWRLPASYALYMTVSTSLLLSSTVVRWPLQSLPRYSLVVFPLFLLLAQIGASPHWHRAIILTGAPLLGLYTALFATWHWVL